MMVELAEDELWNLVKVWTSVFGSLTYCHILGKFIPKGFTRLVAILPVISLFLLLPLKLTSITFCGMTAFFISWLANFKLLLFAFGKPPLDSSPPIPLLRFLAVASFPIILHTQHTNEKYNNEEEIKIKNIPMFFSWNYIIKGVVLPLSSWMLYHYSEYINRNILWIIYIFIISLNIEVISTCVASIPGFFLALKLEPQFKDPLKCTSIQDFWGKRWNLVATDILRPTVYQPSKTIFIRIIGQKLATYPAVMVTFMVSAFAHELIFYYLGRTRPTFEITWFFLVHGLFVCLDIATKKHVAGKWKVPQWISSLVTLSFMVVLDFWLFLPPLFRIGSDRRMLQEYDVVSSFLQSVKKELLW